MGLTERWRVVTSNSDVESDGIWLGGDAADQDSMGDGYRDRPLGSLVRAVVGCRRPNRAGSP